MSKPISDYINNHILDGINHKLDTLIYMVRVLLKTEVLQMATITDVQTKVTAEGTVIDSAVTLLGQLSQMLKDALASNDPTAVQAVIDAIDANTTKLANAVVANTPAA